MSLISIITPTYNGGKYLAQTIASVQRQTFRDYEHIIIDNSPEKTEKPN
jgi:glycosyltransferase involved in cell wall biosynthesis